MSNDNKHAASVQNLKILELANTNRKQDEEAAAECQKLLLPASATTTIATTAIIRRLFASITDAANPLDTFVSVAHMRRRRLSS